MATILQNQLFVWSDYENNDDFYKLNVILSNLPDEALMKKLEKKRGLSGVNKYPIRALWNSLIAMVVYEHLSIESLRRELKRNPLLREVCGFSLIAGLDAVPTSGAYSRFIKNVTEHMDEIEHIFKSLVKQCYEELPGFGKHIGIDGKAIQSYAKKQGSSSNDNRGDCDATWGKHIYTWKDENSKIHEKKKTWFGYLAHIIADTTYELPILFDLDTANSSEIKKAYELIDTMASESPEYLKRCEYFTGDKGYDATELHKTLWYTHIIKPIIDIRHSWKDGEKTRAYEKHYGVVYDNKGTVSCICPKTKKMRDMAFKGFEKKRNCLKYVCPSKHYGFHCEGCKDCTIPRQIRIPLKENIRIFTPVARSSYKWKRLYNHRTALERINSRIDNVFGFENHTIRGLTKMKFRITLAFIIMQSFALGKVREGKEKEIRHFLTA